MDTSLDFADTTCTKCVLEFILQGALGQMTEVPKLSETQSRLLASYQLGLYCADRIRQAFELKRLGQHSDAVDMFMRALAIDYTGPQNVTLVNGLPAIDLMSATGRPRFLPPGLIDQLARGMNSLGITFDEFPNRLAEVLTEEQANLLGVAVLPTLDELTCWVEEDLRSALALGRAWRLPAASSYNRTPQR